MIRDLLGIGALDYEMRLLILSKIGGNSYDKIRIPLLSYRFFDSSMPYINYNKLINSMLF